MAATVVKILTVHLSSLAGALAIRPVGLDCTWSTSDLSDCDASLRFCNDSCTSGRVVFCTWSNRRLDSHGQFADVVGGGGQLVGGGVDLLHGLGHLVGNHAVGGMGQLGDRVCGLAGADDRLMGVVEQLLARLEVGGDGLEVIEAVREGLDIVIGQQAIDAIEAFISLFDHGTRSRQKLGQRTLFRMNDRRRRIRRAAFKQGRLGRAPG